MCCVVVFDRIDISLASLLEFSAEDEARGHQESAPPFSLQVKLVTQRTFQFYWRYPTYIGAKLALNLIAGLSIGSSFWNQGTLQTTASLQNKLFTISPRFL